MSWFYLFLAGALEVAWAYFLNQSDGLTKPVPAVLSIVLLLASFSLLALALKNLPLGTGYAIWVGIGAIGTAVIGIVYLGESKSFPKLFCILLILLGVVGLKFFGVEKPDPQSKSQIETPQS